MRRGACLDTMVLMNTSWTTRLFCVVVLAATSAGCVSAQEHRDALSDLQRLRMEAWQRSVEASALRIALDRAAAENAQLRGTSTQMDERQMLAALAAKLDEVSRRQEVMEDEIKASSQCVQAPGGVTPASATGAAAQPPKSRKVTDLLYSRF